MPTRKNPLLRSTTAVITICCALCHMNVPFIYIPSPQKCWSKYNAKIAGWHGILFHMGSTGNSAYKIGVLKLCGVDFKHWLADLKANMDL